MYFNIDNCTYINEIYCFEIKQTFKRYDFVTFDLFIYYLMKVLF